MIHAHKSLHGMLFRDKQGEKWVFFGKSYIQGHPHRGAHEIVLGNLSDPRRGMRLSPKMFQVMFEEVKSE